MFVFKQMSYYIRALRERLGGTQVPAFFGSSVPCYLPDKRELSPCYRPVPQATKFFDQPSENKRFLAADRSQDRAGAGRKRGKQGGTGRIGAIVQSTRCLASFPALRVLTFVLL
jgi:hypothetical protein